MTPPAHPGPAQGGLLKPLSTDAASAIVRIKSSELFGAMRELEIDHQGRIYRLRLTQLNKLILTA